MSKVIKFIKKYWITALIIVAGLIAYTAITEAKMVNTFVFVPVRKVVASFQEFWPTLLLNMVHSFALLFPSLIIGTLIAFGLGMFMGLSKRAYEVLYPIVYAVSVIPALLLSPIALHVAPTFRSASMFLVIYSVIWPTLFAVITGITTIDKRYMDNAATLELSGLKKTVKVILPAAMPSIMSGFITSLRSSFTTLVFAEMYGAEYGMGFFVKKFANFGIYPNVWSGFIYMVIVLVIVVWVFERIKNRLLKWTMD